MKSSSKLVVLFAGIAVSATAVASAYADDGPRGMRDGKGYHHGKMMHDGMRRGGEGRGLMFQRADTDNSGTVTLEEFAAMSPLSFSDADADGNGSVNVDELAAQMEREMLRRRATRMIERFDADNDGEVSLAEIENRREKMFARLDVDGSGAIEEDELRHPRGEGRWGGHGEGHGFKRHHGGGFGRN